MFGNINLVTQLETCQETAYALIFTPVLTAQSKTAHLNLNAYGKTLGLFS
jgi:hypothetical protein